MIKRYLSTVTSSASKSSNDDINEGFRKIIPTSLNYSNGTTNTFISQNTTIKYHLKAKIQQIKILLKTKLVKT